MRPTNVCRVIGFVALGAALLSPACGRREHIRAGYGSEIRAFLHNQKQPKQAPSTEGLDSEEAALIHANYRKTLGDTAPPARQETTQVLLLQPDSQGSYGKSAK